MRDGAPEASSAALISGGNPVGAAASHDRAKVMAEYPAFQ